jgi:hypothetical protein
VTIIIIIIIEKNEEIMFLRCFHHFGNDLKKLSSISNENIETTLYAI